MPTVPTENPAFPTFLQRTVAVGVKGMVGVDGDEGVGVAGTNGPR